MYTLIGTAKLNDVDPQAWLANSRQPPSRPAADHQSYGECNPREVRWERR